MTSIEIWVLHFESWILIIPSKAALSVFLKADLLSNWPIFCAISLKGDNPAVGRAVGLKTHLGERFDGTWRQILPGKVGPKQPSKWNQHSRLCDTFNWIQNPAFERKRPFKALLLDLFHFFLFAKSSNPTDMGLHLTPRSRKEFFSVLHQRRDCIVRAEGK